jgi:hypothetical protein
MTLPTNIIFPLHSDNILSGEPANLDKYLRELVFTLQNMYEDIADVVNGNIRGSVLDPGSEWIPVIKDSIDSSITFTYDHQVGWVYRNGIFVDSWFDISWSGSSGATTGNMYVELLYKVAVTNQIPFVGQVQTSSISYDSGTYCVLNAINDTYRAEVWNCGDGVATTNQSSASSGRLIGHIRYMGQQDD